MEENPKHTPFFPSYKATLEAIAAVENQLAVTVVPYTIPGSNRKAAKALKEILDGFSHLKSAIYDDTVQGYYTH